MTISPLAFPTEQSVNHLTEEFSPPLKKRRGLHPHLPFSTIHPQQESSPSIQASKGEIAPGTSSLATKVALQIIQSPPSFPSIYKESLNLWRTNQRENAFILLKSIDVSTLSVPERVTTICTIVGLLVDLENFQLALKYLDSLDSNEIQLLDPSVVRHLAFLRAEIDNRLGLHEHSLKPLQALEKVVSLLSPPEKKKLLLLKAEAFEGMEDFTNLGELISEFDDEKLSKLDEIKLRLLYISYNNYLGNYLSSLEQLKEIHSTDLPKKSPYIETRISIYKIEALIGAKSFIEASSLLDSLVNSPTSAFSFRQSQRLIAVRAEIFVGLGRYDLALSVLEKVSSSAFSKCSPHIKLRLVLLKAECFYALGLFSKALLMIRQFAPSPLEDEPIALSSKRTLITAASLITQKEYSKALDELENFNTDETPLSFPEQFCEYILFRAWAFLEIDLPKKALETLDLVDKKNELIPFYSIAGVAFLQAKTLLKLGIHLQALHTLIDLDESLYQSLPDPIWNELQILKGKLYSETAHYQEALTIVQNIRGSENALPISKKIEILLIQAKAFFGKGDFIGTKNVLRALQKYTLPKKEFDEIEVLLSKIDATSSEDV